MKWTCGNRKLAIAVPCVLGILFGCSESGTQGTDGVGGADGGRICTWDGTGGGVTIPDCSPYRNSAYFVGTIDGKPYDSLWMNSSTAESFDSSSPMAVTLFLPGNGELHLEWPRPVDGASSEGRFIDVTGTLLLPLDMAPRAVKPGSLLREKCAAGLYQYILNVDGGELNGCSVN